jgi:hypothetical protein
VAESAVPIEALRELALLVFSTRFSAFRAAGRSLLSTAASKSELAWLKSGSLRKFLLLACGANLCIGCQLFMHWVHPAHSLLSLATWLMR